METMTRKAADNTYLHRDFHNLLNLGIGYVRRHYGVAGVARYLREFARTFYAPVTEEIRNRSLDAVEDSFRKTFAVEEASELVRFERNGRELIVHILRCPAVEHIRRSNLEPDPLFSATTSEVWSEIAKESGIGYIMLDYDSQTGQATHLFYEYGENHTQPTKASEAFQ